MLDFPHDCRTVDTYVKPPETNSTQSIQETSSSSSSLSYFHYYWGSMYNGIHLNVAWSYISSLFDIITHSVQPSSLRPSYLLSPLKTFPSPSFLRSAPLFSSHAHTTSTFFPGLSLCFLPLSLSPLLFHFLINLILSSLLTLHIHHSILISATSNFFSCAFFNSHVSAQYSNRYRKLLTFK